jgi:hypothetical protein
MERDAAGVRYRDLGASAVRIEVFEHRRSYSCSKPNLAWII